MAAASSARRSPPSSRRERTRRCRCKRRTRVLPRPPVRRARIASAPVTRVWASRTRAAAVVVAMAIAGAALPAFFGSESSEAGSPPPNIVVIMTDDQTMKMLSYLDSVERHIGDKGVTFTNSYASFPLCCPSRATHLTGQYAHTHGVQDNTKPLGGYERFVGQDQTLATALDD